MVKCVSDHTGARLVRQDGRGGGEYKRGGKSKTWFGRFLLSQGYIKRSHWQVRVRNLIERERNSNQSKAFSTEDSTDVVQKSNKKRQVPNCCLKYSSIYLSRCHNFPPTLESWFRISPPKEILPIFTLARGLYHKTQSGEIIFSILVLNIGSKLSRLAPRQFYVRSCFILKVHID